MTQRTWVGLLLAAVATSFATAHAADEAKLNVLFIAVDDLRPGQLACYGNAIARSPNIDRLADRGLLFNRAYCQQAVCSPSRTSLLTGRRPDTTRVYDLRTHFRDTIPDVITLPQHFKRNSYHTQGISKIYHGGLDDPASWSVPHERPDVPGVGPAGQAELERLREEVRASGRDPRKVKIRGLPYEAPEVEDNELLDGATADRAIELLGELKDGDQPFFLAVGFIKPHLPFVAPKKYWDMYSPEEITLPEDDTPPLGAPKYALTNWGELRAYSGIPSKGPLNDEQTRNLIHGYYACVSYMDAQVGRLLDALDRNGLADNTVVILWGDHGWKLGEHGMWCKHTNYELDTRVPLIVARPGQKTAGQKTDALVEFVDIYPSLAEVCGLPTSEGVEGTSFAPLLEDSDQPWKRAAFSQYPRSIPNVGRGMGYSMRTDRYHLVEWSAPGKSFAEYELYDHRIDPEEDINLAAKPEYAKLVKDLADQLHDGWRAARPSER